MLFDSIEYFLFFSIVYLLYLSFGSNQFRKTLLLCASYFFYMSWNPAYGALLLITSIYSYLFARAIERTNSGSVRKILLAVSISTALSVLFFFKYWNFLTINVNNLLFPNFSFKLSDYNFILPIGISFYTFNVLSYLIDTYRNKAECKSGLLDYLMYVSFFPYLISGPITRAVEFLPLLKSKASLNRDMIAEGGILFVAGLFKKMVCSDNLSIYVNPIFANPTNYSSLELILGAYAFTIQIYCDFSGYTDMARGTALFFGYRLPINFNLPYLSKSPAEFWRRWHMSLSFWFRDYLYKPLGGSHRGLSRTFLNLMIVMGLCGLWHGASWNFVLWGLYYGGLLIAYKLAEITVYQRLISSIPQAFQNKYNYVSDILGMVVMFHLATIGWIMFKAESLKKIMDYLRGILSGFDFGFTFHHMDEQTAIIIAIMAVFFFYNFMSIKVNIKDIVIKNKFNPYVLVTFLLVLLLTAAFTVDEKIQFIYFKF